MINYILLIGGLLGLISVGMGAYVDHVLSQVLDMKTLAMVKTALHYHQIYAVMIAGIGLVCHKKASLFLKLSAWIFIIGVIFFSFSIYLTALTGVMEWIKLTPVGGTLLMVGWLVVLIGASFRKMHAESH